MTRKLNLNTAKAETLTELPGIGPGLAERIIAYRETVGRFRTINELAAVAGITDRLVGHFRDRITVDDTDDEDKDELAPTKVLVVLTGGGEDGYAGHRLTASFTRRELLTGSDGEQTLWVDAQIGVDLPQNGDVTLTFPNRADMRDDVEFRVHAPDGEVLFQDSIAVEKLTARIEFRVKPKQYAQIQPSDNPNFGKPTRLRGRVIDEAGKTQIANRQVVIWGAQQPEPQEDDFFALIVVRTDSSGYFSGAYPTGEFTAAYGGVSVGDEPVSVPIHLQEDGTFSESIILVVDLDDYDCACQDGDECDCNKMAGMVPRDPDMADLARGDGIFSSDPGAGQCVDFTKPDRTLEEFAYSYVVRTTEPDIKGLTLEEPAKIDVRQIASLLGGLGGVAATPAAMHAAAAVDPPVLMMKGGQSKLATEKIDARVLQTLVRDPDGFSLTKITSAANLTAHGDLLRVIAKHLKVKPGRSRISCKNPLDWDDEPTIYQACSIAHGHVLRFKQEWVADGYSMGNLLNSLPLAPGQKKQIAIVDWERRESSARTEAIIETEALASELSRDRDINEVVNGVVSESVRGGSKSSTGAFGGGLGVGGGLFGGAGFLGGLLGIGGGMSSAASSAWQNSSRNTSASALNQLRDRTIQSASAVRSQRSTVVQTMRQGERVIATTETVANYNHCHAITVQYFEVLRHLLVRLRLVDVQECLFVPLLMSRFNKDKVLRWRNTLLPAVRHRRLRKGFDALERIENNYVGSDLPVGSYADQSLEYLDGDLSLRFELARPRDKEDDFDAATWVWISNILPFINPEEFYKNFLKDQQFKDRVFLEQLGPRIAERFVQYMQFSAVLNDDTEVDLPVDATLLSDFVNERRLHVSLRLAADLPPLRRRDIKFIKISGQAKIESGPLLFLFQLLPANSKVIVESGNMRYRTQYSSDYLFRDARIRNDISNGDDARIYTPLNRREQRNPREEDKEVARHLLDHLNEHIERYHHAIWWRTSPDRRYMLLDGFQAPHSGGRSVASVVDNELIGIVGNCLIMPVSRGFHLDPTFRQDVDEMIDLLEHYAPNTPIEPMRIALPTRGVYAEAVMGACNSCEMKEEERFWRWEESPIPDSPPAILPVSTDSRRAEPPDMTAKDFPAPLINLQNAPAAPDPTGLSAALQLLGTPNIFKDITGLEGTQQNAREALQGALDTAQFFGGKAADLALQAKMARDIDKAMRTIKSAKDSGLISDQKAQELAQNAIQGMIGGGANSQSEPISTQDVQQLMDTAGQNDANVRVSRPTGERVEVDARREGRDDSGTPRPSIILPPATNEAENRAFRPGSQDKTSVIDLEATVRSAPAGATFRWSRPDPSTITIDNPNSPRTRIRGIRPGTTAVDFSVHDSSGNQLASTKIQLSVPQFVRVIEDEAAFNGALAAVHLDDVKEAVIARAKTVVDHLLSTSNVRTVWQLGGLAETMPAHIPAANLITATFRGDPPAGNEGLLGQTNPPGGLGVFNETVDIFPGAYDDPGSTDVDAETTALIIEMESADLSDPDLKSFAIEVYGRLLGETLAHEIVHALLWDQINPPSDHNNPAVPNDLMNAGFDRDFRKRTSFEDTAHVSPLDPANFVDHGIPSIGGLQATNQTIMNTHFPVPPSFL